MYSIHKQKFGNNPQTFLHLKSIKSLIPFHATEESYFNQYIRFFPLKSIFLKSSLESIIQLRLRMIQQ